MNAAGHAPAAFADRRHAPYDWQRTAAPCPRPVPLKEVGVHMPGSDWTAHVETVCRERGLQMTALRREIVAIFAGAGQPMGAYAIIQKLSDAQKRQVAPPTVYRTLDFLVENGFVVKIESRQTFVACDHHDHEHNGHGLLFSCAKCGRASEVESGTVDREVAAIASRLAFTVERKVLEIEGLCGACRSQPS